MASDKNLLRRAELIGFSKAAVARSAGVHVQTVGYLDEGRPDRRGRARGASTGTVRKIEAAIEAREIEILDTLLPIHLDARIDRIAELLRHKGFRLERDAA
ncbi:hypothetical protein ACWX0K_10830 [Nitrobacteraceae bacterium UC4446_H13]